MHASPHTTPSTHVSLALALTLSMSTSSCSTHRHATEVVTHTARDTLYINKLHYDSIFIALATQDIFLHEQILSHHLVVYHTIMQSFSNAKCRYESTHISSTRPMIFCITQVFYKFSYSFAEIMLQSYI